MFLFFSLKRNRKDGVKAAGAAQGAPGQSHSLHWLVLSYCLLFWCFYLNEKLSCKIKDKCNIIRTGLCSRFLFFQRLHKAMSVKPQKNSYFLKGGEGAQW
jgi:hypothetical protein